MNPFVEISAQGRQWVCPICLGYNILPTELQGTIPTQTLPANTTVEYILNNRAPAPPIFVFVLDTCLEKDDFEALVEQISITLNLLPSNALVGLITFGKNVDLYQVNSDDVLKSYSFNGSKDYTYEQVAKILGFLSSDLQSSNRTDGQNQLCARFLQPVSMAEYSLTLILENLSKDAWPHKSNERSFRATGCALNVASKLLKATYAKAGSHVMLFAGGPCTYGPGLIVGNQLKEPIRTHHLIESKDSIHFKTASAYYSKLADECSTIGITVDIFVGSYDQVGLFEMDDLPDKTGGVIVLADSFTTSIFKQSFQRVFSKNQYDELALGLNATLEVKTSKEWKIAGLIGHATSLNRKDSNISDSVETRVGVSGTSAWKVSTILPNTTYSIVFDIQNSTEQGAYNLAQLPHAFVQFITYYQHSDGSTRLKVTTVPKPLTSQDVSHSFDQEASAVLIGRLAIDKLIKNTDIAEVLSWVDKKLIGLLKAFAEYHKNEASSFRISNQFSLFPQFIYHLRRSQFLQVFNNSPDETVFYRHVFNTEDTFNSLIMIQPTLTSFEQDAEEEGGMPVLLDSVSLQPERILLLDTFFHILIFHGATVAEWRRQGYQDQEDYVYFKEFLEEPRREAAELLIDRFPLPRFIDTEEGGSQARFLYSKLNPSNTYNDDSIAIGTGAKILTDDISLQKFMEHVQKLVVSPN
jgi:protein transport protein SEC23